MAFDTKYRSVVRISIALISLLVASSSANSGLYLQIYPDQDSGNGTQHLYFGLMQSFGGGYDGSGNVPGVQVALDQINEDSAMLPGYTLHYTLSDSQCNRRMGLNEFFQQMLGDPEITKIVWFGSGCSPATEPTAEISHYFNITQVSGVSSSPELSNREAFKYYFQLLPPDDDLALGFFAIIRRYQWKHVAIIQQDENIFTVAMEKLKELLDAVKVTYSERFFGSQEGVAELGDDLFEDEARIFVLSMYEPLARDTLCEAYARNIRYPTHLLLTYMYTWYSTEEWWLLTNGNESCTPENRASVMEYVVGPIQFEFITNYSTVSDTEIDGYQYNTSYFDHLINSPLNIPKDRFEGYSVYCYDTTWTMAYALNRTLTDLLTNETLRRMAGNESELEDPDGFGLENFTYKNRIIAKTMFEHLEATNFTGLTGPISFDENGIRAEGLLVARQVRYNEDSQLLELVDIGSGTGAGENTSFEYIDGWMDQTVWPDGVPYDGVPIEEIVTVAVPLTVIYSTFATAGIIFTIACLVFNFIMRNKKLIRLTSPNLSYIIGVGAILLYVDVYLTVVPTEDKDGVTVLCNITLWLTSLGYSLLFGTILVKMARVYYIFSYPTVAKNTRTLTDWKLALVVLVLVMVDLVILVVYTAVEGARGNLEAEKIENRENLREVKGERELIYEYYFYTCMSTSRDVTLGILYGYKAVLQVVSLFFAFQIRKVKVKGLNDAKYIVVAVYVTSIILTVIIVSTYSLVEFVNIYPVVFGLSILVGATAILLLVFVTKMIGLYKDPEGEKVFSTQHQRTSHSINQSDTVTAGGEMELTSANNNLVNTLRKRVTELESMLSQSHKQDTENGGTLAPVKVSFREDNIKAQ